MERGRKTRERNSKYNSKWTVKKQYTSWVAKQGKKAGGKERKWKRTNKEKEETNSKNRQKRYAQN